METAPETRVRRIADVGAVVVLYALLVLPAVGTFAGWGGSASLHPPAPFPAWPHDVASLEAYPAGLEGWFEDALGMRGLLIRWNNRVETLWLRDSTGTVIIPETWMAGSDGAALRGVYAGSVVQGADGWFFYFTGPLLRDFRALEQPSPAVVRRWTEAIARRRRFAESVGAHYLLVIVPEKQTVYPEQVPPALRRLSEARWSETLVDAMERDHLPLLVLRPALERAKSTGNLYPPTGTHWNDVGAGVAAVEIFQRLAQWFPAVGTPREPVRIVRRRRPGLELAIFLGLRDLLPETVPVAVLPPPRARVIKRAGKLGEVRVLVKETHDPELPTAVVFHDSFTPIGLEPLLSEAFERVTYAWGDTFDGALVAAERPDVVLEIRAERFLLREEPPGGTFPDVAPGT